MAHPLPTDQQWLLLHEIDVNPSAVFWDLVRRAWLLEHGGVVRVVTGQVKRLQQLGYIDIEELLVIRVNYDGRQVLQRRELVDVINRVNARSK